MDTIEKPKDRAAINRENASHSTGPRTPEGKQVSRMNAMKHGLASQTLVSSKANLDAFRDFSHRFFQDLQPKGVIEEQLVQTLADTSWRLNCGRAYENNLLTLGAQTPAAALDTGQPEIDFALATAASYRNQAKTFAALSMQQQRVSREFHRTLKELREIQAERRAQERVQMEEAAQLYKLHAEEQKATATEPITPYDATQDGFVLATAEIETHIGRQQRKTAAHAAERSRAAGGFACEAPNIIGKS